MRKIGVGCAVLAGFVTGVLFFGGVQQGPSLLSANGEKDSGSKGKEPVNSRLFDRLPDVFTVKTLKNGRSYRVFDVKAEKGADLKSKFAFSNPRVAAFYVIGDSAPNNTTTYFYEEHDIHPALTDRDGGTIRLIMQHEISGSDELRMIDEHISTEFTTDVYGKRGRHAGLYGWTRQSGGGDHSWILGDGARHNLAEPWGWAWVLDYKWRDGEQELPRGRIRFYTHPHVTTRVVILD